MIFERSFGELTIIVDIDIIEICVCVTKKPTNMQSWRNVQYKSIFFVIYTIILKSDIFTKWFTSPGSVGAYGRFRPRLKDLKCCFIPWKLSSYAKLDDIVSDYYFNVTFLHDLISMKYIIVAYTIDDISLQKNSRLFINNTGKDMTHFREIRKSLASRKIRSVIKK